MWRSNVIDASHSPCEAGGLILTGKRSANGACVQDGHIGKVKKSPVTADTIQILLDQRQNEKKKNNTPFIQRKPNTSPLTEHVRNAHHASIGRSSRVHQIHPIPRSPLPLKNLGLNSSETRQRASTAPHPQWKRAATPWVESATAEGDLSRPPFHRQTCSYLWTRACQTRLGSCSSRRRTSLVTSVLRRRRLRNRTTRSRIRCR